MSSRRRFLRKGGVLAAGKAAGQAISFGRNFIVAKILGPEEFGIAFTFAMTISLLEMISNVSWESLIVQAPDGDSPRLQRTAHCMLLLRGILNAALIYLLAGTIAHYFDVPEATGAFQWLALVPLLRGFAHLDRKRLQRELDYVPDTVVEVSSQVASMAVAWPLAVWLRDHRAMLVAVIVQAGIQLASSHLLARRRYELRADRETVRRFLGFGWPLLVNGVLMFAIFQGESLIVGGTTSVAALGIFGIAVLLTRTPSVLVANIAGPLLLPLFSREREDGERFAARYQLAVQGLAVVGAALALFLVGAGGPLLEIYDEKYAPAAGALGWLAAGQALRILRMAPTVAAMSHADTRNSMIANIWRVTALPLTLLVAMEGGSLTQIAATGVAGEIAALASTSLRLRRLLSLPLGTTLRPALLLAAAMGATVALGRLVPAELPAWGRALCGTLGAAVLGAGFVLGLARARAELIAGIRHVRETVCSGRA